jgi:hypothetical protein
MTPTPEIQKEFCSLLGALREGTLNEQQKARLDSLLGEYPSLQNDYVESVLLWYALRCYQPLSQEEQSRVTRKMTESCPGPNDFWHVIEKDLGVQAGDTKPNGRESADVKAIEREAQRRLDRFLAEQEEIRRLQRADSESRCSLDLTDIASRIGQHLVSLYRSVARAAILTALALVVLLGIQYARSSRVVATLTDSMDAKWDVKIAPGASLQRGQFKLERGYARVAFRKGADVLIEAPAEFQLRSAQRMALDSGQLMAEVPPSARGFRVDTAQASIVDLGTQFGIKAGSDQTSDLHLFKGQASLTPRATGAAVAGQILTEGQARRVDAAGQVCDIQIDRTAFVRRFFSKSGFIWRGQPIDLADVVGGGNGFGTGRLNRWLEISTGLDGTRYIVNGWTMQPYQTTDNRYHRVTHLPYVDGVFSPDGSAGPVRVSSQNHLWWDCPKTAGTFFEDIFNGDHISVGDNSHGFVLSGQAFGTREHPAIALHSNAGITFDLDAMRADMPGLEITEFKAMCGVSEDVKKHPEDAQQGKSDFWLLVDGKKRFEAIGMDVDSKPQEISVPLSTQERFVTLVTTDGDGRPNYDWSFFAEPRLEIQALQ